MGYFKNIDIDMQNEERDSEIRELHLDSDINWWQAMDSEMQLEDRKAELIEIERQAEIWMLRSLGVM